MRARRVIDRVSSTPTCTAFQPAKLRNHARVIEQFEATRIQYR